MNIGELIGLVFNGTQPEKVLYEGEIWEYDEFTKTYTNVYGVDLYEHIIEEIKELGLKAGETRIELVYELEV